MGVMLSFTLRIADRGPRGKEAAGEVRPPNRLTDFDRAIRSASRFAPAVHLNGRSAKLPERPLSLPRGLGQSKTNVKSTSSAGASPFVFIIIWNGSTP